MRYSIMNQRIKILFMMFVFFSKIISMNEITFKAHRITSLVLGTAGVGLVVGAVGGSAIGVVGLPVLIFCYLPYRVFCFLKNTFQSSKNKAKKLNEKTKADMNLINEKVIFENDNFEDIKQ